MKVCAHNLIMYEFALFILITVVYLNVSHKQTLFYDKERPRAETHARVLRLQLQYQNNEDQCPTNKIIEIDHANTTTIEEDNDILLPMDCESPGEDDIDDTSNWRSVTPCEVYSERPCSGTSTTASELGKTLPTVCNELERTQLVVSTSTTSQWTPHHHEERRKDTRHCLR